MKVRCAAMENVLECSKPFAFLYLIVALMLEWNAEGIDALKRGFQDLERKVWQRWNAILAKFSSDKIALNKEVT
jgi:hypothetical protein